MSILNVDGTRIAYDEHGKRTRGEKLVFLHGCALNRLMWRPQMDALRGSHRVVAVDMRGHGASDIPGGLTSLDRMADDVHALAQALELGPIVLVGHAMGSLVALEFARKYPAGVRALVLSDVSGDTRIDESFAERKEMMQTIADGGSAAAAKAMVSVLLSKESIDANPDLVIEVRRMIETTSVTGMAGAIAGIDEFVASADALESISSPTLILSGAENASDLERAGAVREAIRDSQLVVIKSAERLANLENPADFTAALTEFLSTLNTVDEATDDIEASEKATLSVGDPLIADTGN